MPQFSFTARDAAGQNQSGQQEAPSANALVGELRERGWLVLEVKASQGSATSFNSWWPSQWLPPRSSDVSLSLRQLSVMLRSGLTLLAALNTVSKHSRRGRLCTIWSVIGDRIEEGTSFADALKEHSCFSDLVVQLTRVGEETGTLDKVLLRASEALEAQRTLKTSVFTALMYPTVVLVMTIGVTAYMIFDLIPKLERFLGQIGKRLPAITQLLLDISQYCRDYFIQGSVLLVSASIGFYLFYNWLPGRLWVDKWSLRIPIMGTIFRLTGTLLLSRSLELLLASGITLIEGLRSVELLMPNKYLGQLIGQARERVLQGSELAGPLTVNGAFEPMLGQMIAVGEQSGTLEETLNEVTIFYEAELSRLVKRLSILIEPVIIAIIGGIVGFVYIAVFMALYAAAGG
ncbi:MAG: type II secretion system F family protein [Planctomycetota bacterium]|nr:type II secretion system F family protein [Planctomycetota bacterium]